MSNSTNTAGTTAAALTALQSFQKVAEQAEAIAERVANGDDFPAAVRELNHLKLTTQATAAVWQTLDDLAETLLSRPRK